MYFIVVELSMEIESIFPLIRLRRRICYNWLEKFYEWFLRTMGKTKINRLAEWFVVIERADQLIKLSINHVLRAMWRTN